MKKGGGIIPITIKNGEILVMLGRESEDVRSDGAGKWSDFGGVAEKRETYKECAVREGFEETMGMFGSQDTLSKLIDTKLACELKKNKYKSFAIHVNYKKNLPEDFSMIYNCAMEEEPHLIYENNGFFEKDKVQWFKLERLKDHKDCGAFTIRDHFKPILSDLCDQLLG